MLHLCHIHKHCASCPWSNCFCTHPLQIYSHTVNVWFSIYRTKGSVEGSFHHRDHQCNLRNETTVSFLQLKRDLIYEISFCLFVSGYKSERGCLTERARVHLKLHPLNRCDLGIDATSSFWKHTAFKSNFKLWKWIEFDTRSCNTIRRLSNAGIMSQIIVFKVSIHYFDLPSHFNYGWVFLIKCCNKRTDKMQNKSQTYKDVMNLGWNIKYGYNNVEYHIIFKIIENSRTSVFHFHFIMYPVPCVLLIFCLSFVVLPQQKPIIDITPLESVSNCICFLIMLAGY